MVNVVNKENDLYLSVIKNSSLAFKTKKVARELFELWKDFYNKRYPDNDFSATSRKLAYDLQNSMALGLEVLFEEQSEENIFYKIGFLHGFFKSNVCTKWYRDYIYPILPDYKNLLLVKAILIYFQSNAVAVNSLRLFHEHFVGEEINVIINDNVNMENVIRFDKYNMNKEKVMNQNFLNNMQHYLESILLEKNERLFNAFGEESIPELSNLFSDKEILSLISACSRDV